MNRRSFLKGLLFVSSVFTFKLKASKKNNISFDFGVASGDPTNTNIILWTKVTPSLKKDIPINWQLSAEELQLSGKDKIHPSLAKAKDLLD